jgi:hypothetical protein
MSESECQTIYELDTLRPQNDHTAAANVGLPESDLSASMAKETRRGRMTKAEAADLHAMWKQQGEPLCEHPSHELARLALNDDGVLMGTYYCRECGEVDRQICDPHQRH